MNHERVRDPGFGRRVAMAAALAMLFPLAGCLGVQGYYRAEDAPAHVKAGQVDPRLAFTRTVGGRVLELAADHAFTRPEGALPRQDGFLEELERTLRPLDILLVRSPAGLTRDNAPSYYTHSGIWLGTVEQLKREGLWNARQLRALRNDIEQGRSALESAENGVAPDDLARFAERDSILILRPSGMSRKERLDAFRRIVSLLGTGFDYNYDRQDESRLTCIELIEAVLPQIELPARYAQGRYATIPDDAARGAIEGWLPLKVVKHYSAGKDGKLVELDAAQTLALLTRPREKPGYPFY